MDDTAQKQNQTNDNAQTQPQIIPVGTVNKEIETGAVSDYITPSEPEMIR